MLVNALQAAASSGQVRLRPEFRATLRDRVMALAQAQADALPGLTTSPQGQPRTAGAVRPSPRTTSPRVQRCLRITAGSLASLIALTGIAASSSRSLPGDPFYPVKRVAESLQLQTTGGDAAKGAKHLEFAGTRLDEIRQLINPARAYGGPATAPGTALADGLSFGGAAGARIRAALGDMDSDTRQGNDLLTHAFDQEGQLAPLRVITVFSTQQGRELQALIPSLPVAARELAQASLDLIARVGATAQHTLSSADRASTDGRGALPVPAAPASPEPAATGSRTATVGAQPDQRPTGPGPLAAAPPPAFQPTGRPPARSATRPAEPAPTVAPAPTHAGRPTGPTPPAPSHTPSQAPTAPARPSQSPTANPTPLPLPAPIPQPPPLPPLPVIDLFH